MTKNIRNGFQVRCTDYKEKEGEVKYLLKTCMLETSKRSNQIKVARKKKL